MLRSFLLAACMSACVIFLITAVYLLPQWHSSYRPWNHAKPSSSSAKTDLDQSFETLSRKCLDPYKQPGVLHVASGPDTRWLPLDEAFYHLRDPASATYPADSDPDFRNTLPPDAVVQGAPSNWMKGLVAEHTKLNASNASPSKSAIDPKLSWIWGKRVLLIGDSITRQESEHFCAELGLKKGGRGGQRYMNEFCHVPLFNFTTFHWHIPSMYTRKNSSWWWPGDMKYVPFEERLPHVHMPYKEDFIGANGRSPDLIIWHSGLWDEMAFHNLATSRKGDSGGLGSKNRHISWDEATFFAARLKKFLALLDETFSADVPSMYLSLTTGKGIDNMDLFVIDLDRITRAICKQRGIEVFDWSRIINGHSHMYKDDVHPKRGPLTWLWANMMTSYLFRAVGGLEIRGRVEQYPQADKLVSGTDGAWNHCHDFNMRYQS